jgi:hypothetical protein
MLDTGITLADVNKNLLYVLEQHTNNYFNQGNDPDDPARNYPEAFLELAYKIQAFRLQPHLFMNKRDEYGGAEMMTSWQKVFADDLAVFKRVRTL